MSNFFSNLRASFEKSQNRIARERAREVLLRMSDRALADAGFSRELVESGVKAWPWRAEEPAQLTPLKFDTVNAHKAIDELAAYSDKDLQDLGISRSGIPEAVKLGRVGIERERQRRAA